MDPSTRNLTSLSPFEVMVARGGRAFLVRLFDRWPPDSLFKLSRLNYNTHHNVRLYVQLSWNPTTSLKHWFHDPEASLETLGVTNAVICGPFVMKFFDRNSTPMNDLDICVRIDGLLQLGNEIIRQGFLFSPTKGDHKRFDITSLMQSGKKGFIDTSCTTEPRSRLDPLVRHFHFVRYMPNQDGSIDILKVIVHLVRWEPWRYILCAESTAVVNLITATHAISMFPQHTFLERTTMQAGQDNCLTDEMTSRWLDDYAGYNFTRIRGGGEIVSNLATGRRRVGDRACWVINFAAFDKVFGTRSPEIKGPVFEVLDWTSKTPLRDSYLRLADLFVWSSWAFLRGYIPALFM